MNLGIELIFELMVTEYVPLRHNRRIALCSAIVRYFDTATVIFAL